MYTLNCKGRLLSLEKPVVMGILNLTPDSFYAGSRTSVENILQEAEKMIAQGVAILDIGGQSTRPGSDWLSAAQEWDRLREALPLLCSSFPSTFFSIDTFHHEVAARALEAGVHIVNDISAGRLDPEMIPLVAAAQVPFVCMHSRGTPQTMSALTSYEDIILEMTDYFIERTAACREAGIRDIILDPGLGFAKTIAQNFRVLKEFRQFHLIGCPLLLGVSRKSMVWKTLGVSAAEAGNGTTVLNAWGLERGAHILRVHDVREAVEAIRLYEALNNA